MVIIAELPTELRSQPLTYLADVVHLELRGVCGADGGVGPVESHRALPLSLARVEHVGGVRAVAKGVDAMSITVDAGHHLPE